MTLHKINESTRDVTRYTKQLLLERENRMVFEKYQEIGKTGSCLMCMAKFPEIFYKTK